MTGNEGDVYEQVPNVKGKFALYPLMKESL